MHPSRVICTPLLPYRVLMEVTLIDVFLTIVFMLIGYLAGAIPTGLFVARARGVDIRKLGSGNIGATNVLRTMGTLPALLVVLVDPLKAFLAVYFPVWLGADPWTVALTGFAVLLGNTYNVFLGLRGGARHRYELGTLLCHRPAHHDAHRHLRYHDDGVGALRIARLISRRYRHAADADCQRWHRSTLLLPSPRYHDARRVSPPRQLAALGSGHGAALG